MIEQEKIEISEIEKLLEDREIRRIPTDILDKVFTLVIAALGVVAALAWHEALQHVFESIFGDMTSLGGEIYYAVVVTALAALISVLLGKFIVKKKKAKYLSEKP